MDALEFLKKIGRICKTVGNCAKCPVNDLGYCSDLPDELEHPKDIVKAVEEYKL